jgi:betaine-aldehyde dehydrogenase
VGSVPTGKAVLKSAADSMKRTQLELGGKNALIICPDADLDAAINGAVKGMNLGWTAGQSCGSTSRILVHSSVYDAVVEGIEAAFSAVKLGDPLSQDTEMGSLSTASQFQRVTDYIASAKQQGATIRVGAAPDHDDNDTSSAHKDGFFVKPTLLVDVTSDMTIAREEVFGPVLSILQWDDEDEMIDIANGLDVGLTASIWTESLDTAMRLTGKIQAGYVWVNDSSDHYLGAPFGGMKSSGQGREECLEELLAYTEAKTVTIVQKNRS